MKIPVTSHGGICCASKDCRFKRECANHVTAGEFRSEDGFTPVLRIMAEGGITFALCESYYEEEGFSGFPAYYPSTGSVYLKDGARRIYTGPYGDED